MTDTTLEPLAGPMEASATLAGLIRDHGSDMPAPVFDALAAHYPSPVDRIVTSAEALYAAAITAKPGPAASAFATAAAQLAGLCAANAWHDLGQTARGPKMAGACRRILGLGKQPASFDPTPQARFTAPPSLAEA